SAATQCACPAERRQPVLVHSAPDLCDRRNRLAQSIQPDELAIHALATVGDRYDLAENHPGPQPYRRLPFLRDAAAAGPAVDGSIALGRSIFVAERVARDHLFVRGR